MFGRWKSSKGEGDAMNDEKKDKPTPEGQGDGSGTPTGAEGVNPADAMADVDQTQQLISEMEQVIERLRSERDEARAAHKHALAEFSNYQKRAHSNEQSAKEQGLRNMLYSVMPVIDHFDMALLHDPEKVSAKQVMDGVTMIKEELLRVLASHGVTIVSPRPDEDFDPKRHEAIMHKAQEGVRAGHVVLTLRPGFELGGRLVRPAQVAVAPAAE